MTKSRPETGFLNLRETKYVEAEMTDTRFARSLFGKTLYPFLHDKACRRRRPGL